MCSILSETRSCDLVISVEGLRFDPLRIDGIQQMDKTVFGAKLQQCLCVMQSMRSAIPCLSHLIRPLSFFLEEVYKCLG